MEICWGYRSTLFFYALRDVFRLEYPGMHCKENNCFLLELPEYMWCARAPKGFALFDYLNKNLMYEVRFTILNPKSQIVNLKSQIRYYLHPVHVVAVQLPQPPELPWELVSFPLLPADIPNTENILWIWSLWQDGQNNFFRSLALRKYSSNFVVHLSHWNSYIGIIKLR